MVKLTMIARVLDGVPLAEGLDTDASLDLEYYKQRRKERSKISPEELERRTLQKFIAIHGEDKAKKMMWAMKQRNPNYFVDKAKQSR